MKDELNSTRKEVKKMSIARISNYKTAKFDRNTKENIRNEAENF